MSKFRDGDVVVCVTADPFLKLKEWELYRIVAHSVFTASGSGLATVQPLVGRKWPEPGVYWGERFQLIARDE